jgi:hypothetical protein
VFRLQLCLYWMVLTEVFGKEYYVKGGSLSTSLKSLTLCCFVEKDPATKATDAPQPYGFLCNPMMKRKMIIFSVFPSNGAQVERNWQGKTAVLGGKSCLIATLSTTNPTQTDLGSNPDLCGGRPAAYRLYHGTALLTFIYGEYQKMRCIWLD